MNLNYEWTLKNANFTKNQGKVFSCFACGGGSTMGYKLAGFDVIGFNEIDPKMAECYITNHNPKYSYIEPIQEFKNRSDLPEELYNLDILDGSPPCSSFSMAGNREKDWGKEKKFREGQQNQVLDTLFFDFIDLAKKLQPKVVVAENVKGMLQGSAKDYVSKVLIDFDKAGYYVDYKLLDASKMGVPQKRERVFFYAIRKDLYNGSFTDLFMSRPLLKLDFNEKEILFKNIYHKDSKEDLAPVVRKYWEKRQNGDKKISEIKGRETGNNNSLFSYNLLTMDKVCGTLTSKKDSFVLYDFPRYLNTSEFKKIGSFPLDYNFCNQPPYYLIGMSVPPIMTARIANEINNQWLKKIKE